MKKLYILGISRGGTTVLASLLGAHSDINMLFQSTSGDQNKLTGKKYQGNKLCVHHDIRWKKKNTRWREFIYYKTKFILKRFINYYYLRPSAKYNLYDIINKQDSKIIIITRDKNENIRSMIQWQNRKRKQAEKEYTKGMIILHRVMNLANNYYHVTLYDLTKNIESTKKQLLRICKYLDIEFEPKMLLSAGMNDVYKNSVIEPKK